MRLVRRRIWIILQCLKFCVKFSTFVFWASLCLATMTLTFFKSSAPVGRDLIYPDNYTQWQLQGPVLGGEYQEIDYRSMEIDSEAVENELSKRAALVGQVCEKHGLHNQSINSKEFFIDHKHKLVWCTIFKAASSAWLYKFNLLGGYSREFLSKTRHNPIMLARKKFPRPSEEEVIDAISNPGVVSLLVVREPFVRLLSAYRDKLENITPFYRRLAKMIIALHRKNATKLLSPKWGYGPTFYEFVAYLIDIYKNKSKRRPSNEHWAPYYKFCSLCAVNFSVIAKVETLSRDTAYVVQQLSIADLISSQKINNRRTLLRKIMNKSKDGRNTTSLLRHYFQQIDEQMLNDLLQIYGIDFEMFGYDPDIYRSYVRKQKFN